MKTQQHWPEQGWADDLEASGGGLASSAIDLATLSASLKKPLRPLWFGADRGVEGIPAGYEETLLTEVSNPHLILT